MNKNKNILYNILVNVYRFLMRNLEIVTLCFILQFWLELGGSWKYWITISLVSLASGISIAWRKDNDK